MCLIISKNQTSAALIYDSVYFFVRALNIFAEKYKFNTTSLTCDAQQPWIHGSAFAHFLKTVGPHMEIIFFILLHIFRYQFEANGITGKIKFDENGLRTDISFEVVDLAPDGIQKVCKDIVQLKRK